MELSEIKRQFFAYRNGLLADALRKQTFDSHRMIFGLNLPQLVQIAAETGQDEVLADSLWADADCRESRLLAPMICPRSALRLHWLKQVSTVEEADVLCHRLLRHQAGASEFAVTLAESTEEPLLRYAALRLLLNLMPDSSSVAISIARQSLDNPITKAVSNQILNYIS